MRSTRPTQSLLLYMAFGFSASFVASPAFGVALWGTGAVSLTDLENKPNEFYRFDPALGPFDVPVIRWKMTDQFRARFPLAKEREQVRLAIGEWEDGIVQRSTARSANVWLDALERCLRFL